MDGVNVDSLELSTTDSQRNALVHTMSIVTTLNNDLYGWTSRLTDETLEALARNDTSYFQRLLDESRKRQRDRVFQREELRIQRRTVRPAVCAFLFGFVPLLVLIILIAAGVPIPLIPKEGFAHVFMFGTLYVVFAVLFVWIVVFCRRARADASAEIEALRERRAKDESVI